MFSYKKCLCISSIILVKLFLLYCTGTVETPEQIAASVEIAILTATNAEQNAFRHFSKLECGRVWKGAKSYNCEMDPYLKKNGVTIRCLPEESTKDYEIFIVQKHSTKAVKGVHLKCTKTGPWRALERTGDLLAEAQDKEWPLKVIFVVGCCGVCLSEAKKKESEESGKNWCGTVLLSHQAEDYLHKGKAEENSTKYEPETYHLSDEWLSKLHDLAISQPSHVAAKKFRDIPVEVVPKFLSGPLVIKSEVTGRKLSGAPEVVGVEMEVAGTVQAINLARKLKGDLVPHVQVTVVKGVSDYTGIDKTKRSKSVFFGKETEEIEDKYRQEIATLHAITLVSRCIAKEFL